MREFLEDGPEGKRMMKIYEKLFDFTTETRIECRNVNYKSKNERDNW